MSPISAVVTTGIYCRPGCSAKPNRENVRTFELAAAAEAAGFRACLRCRPYRASVSVGAIGPELVCRAVRLVVDGALDVGTEADLAAEVGVSARHLRRLFLTHVGATPDQLARSRRAHFARRLLDDTDLTVTQVAFASGYGSVRQLNRACREIFRDTPVALRARRRVTDRLASEGGLALRLPVDPTYDWAATLALLTRGDVPGDVEDGTYRRTVSIEGDPALLEVRSGGPDHLVLVAHLPRWDGLIHLVGRTRRALHLDSDHLDGERVWPLGIWDDDEVAVSASG